MAFMGDFSLCCEIAKRIPPDADSLSKFSDAERAAQAPHVQGLVGAVCLDFEPAYGRSEIFRLK